MSAELPVELVVAVARHLPGWVLARCVCVCRAWRDALRSSGQLWHAALRADFWSAEDAEDAAVDVLGDARHDYWLLFAREVSAEEQEQWRLRGYPRRDDVLDTSRKLDTALRREPAPWLLDGITGVAARERPVARRGARSLHALRLSLLTLHRPYTVQWQALGEAQEQAPPSRHRSRKLGKSDENGFRRRRWFAQAGLREVRLPQQGAPDAMYRVYTALASRLLRGRCRVCNCATEARHPVLHVPICAGGGACAAAFPIVPLARVAAATGRRGKGKAAVQAAAAGAAVGGGGAPQPQQGGEATGGAARHGGRADGGAAAAM